MDSRMARVWSSSMEWWSGGCRVVVSRFEVDEGDGWDGMDWES